MISYDGLQNSGAAAGLVLVLPVHCSTSTQVLRIIRLAFRYMCCSKTTLLTSRLSSHNQLMIQFRGFSCDAQLGQQEHTFTVQPHKRRFWSRFLLGERRPVQQPKPSFRMPLFECTVIICRWIWNVQPDRELVLHLLYFRVSRGLQEETRDLRSVETCNR